MGRNGKIRRAPGFEDRAGWDFERLDSAIRTARKVLYSRGYQPIETPLIEQTELFLRRSGGLLSSQLFDFTAPDGSNITLRPELTAPVIRHALEQGSRPLPMRFQYAAPIFRYSERPYDAPPNSVPSKRQYTQVGAELIGATQAAADGEIIATAYELAKQLGIKHVAVRIGHVGLIWEVLNQFNLSERAKLFLANNVSTLADGDDGMATVEAESIRLGLMPSQEQQSVEPQAAELLTRLTSRAIQLPTASEQTSRTTEDVVRGLQRKLEHDANNGDFPKAMQLMSKIAQQSSGFVDPASFTPERWCATAEVNRHGATIAYVERLIEEFGLGRLQSVSNLTSVEVAAERGGVDNFDVSVDFGLAASIAYYSGMIFEVSAYVDDELVTIGGGGRYDGLAASLGADQEVPALGFALNLDTILEIVGSSRIGGQHEARRKVVVLAPVGEDAQATIFDGATELREKGYEVFTLFDATSDAGAVAASLGGAEVVLVDASGSLAWVSE